MSIEWPHPQEEEIKQSDVTDPWIWWIEESDATDPWIWWLEKNKDLNEGQLAAKLDDFAKRFFKSSWIKMEWDERDEKMLIRWIDLENWKNSIHIRKSQWKSEVNDYIIREKNESWWFDFYLQKESHLGGEKIKITKEEMKSIMNKLENRVNKLEQQRPIVQKSKETKNEINNMLNQINTHVDLELNWKKFQIHPGGLIRFEDNGWNFQQVEFDIWSANPNDVNVYKKTNYTVLKPQIWEDGKMNVPDWFIARDNLYMDITPEEALKELSQIKDAVKQKFDEIKKQKEEERKKMIDSVWEAEKQQADDYLNQSLENIT